MYPVLSKFLQAAPLVLPRQRLASEAEKSEAGDVGHLRTVGRAGEDPSSQKGTAPLPTTRYQPLPIRRHVAKRSALTAIISLPISRLPRESTISVSAPHSFDASVPPAASATHLARHPRRRSSK
jgi:hypothetical protein